MRLAVSDMLPVQASRNSTTGRSDSSRVVRNPSTAFFEGGRSRRRCSVVRMRGYFLRTLAFGREQTLHESHLTPLQ
jgi:hypothetical protein